MTGRGAVTLGILAGGQATRLGGVDKAWQLFQGMTLIERTLAALERGPATPLVSYNGLQDAMGKLGLLAVGDLRPGFRGPLAGIEALLAACSSDWLLVVPVDLRQIPSGLRETMLGRVRLQGGEHGVVARDIDGLQPLVSLWPVRQARLEVGTSLDQGRASVRDLQDRMGFVECQLAPFQFGNLNTPADFG